MYGKIFEQMYDGSLACGDWEALVTMQQLIVLADEEGVVDMTALAIHRRTTIPLDIIEKGLSLLQQPDPNSRSRNDEGRRLLPLDDDRGWGWRLVNYKYYRDLANRADKKEKDRKRIADKRAGGKGNKNKGVAGCRGVSQKVPKVAHTNTNTNTNTNTKIKTIGLRPSVWDDFVEFRKKIRSPLTDRAKTLALNILIKLKAEGHDPQVVIEQSILNGWKGLFPIKKDKLAQTGATGGGKMARAAEAMRKHDAKSQGSGGSGVVHDVGPSTRLLTES